MAKKKATKRRAAKKKKSKRKLRVWQKRKGIECPSCGGSTRVHHTDTKPNEVFRYRCCDDESCGGRVVTREIAYETGW